MNKIIGYARTQGKYKGKQRTIYIDDKIASLFKGLKKGLLETSL